MKKLTKEDILKGKERTEVVHLEGYNADVVIRPLTDGELSEIFGILGSIPLKDDGTPDIGKIDVVKNFQALRLAVCLGTVEPALKIEDVADMKFGVPEYLGTKILEISGVASGTGTKKKGER
jgi:hypothetical protein